MLARFLIYAQLLLCLFICLDSPVQAQENLADLRRVYDFDLSRDAAKVVTGTMDRTIQIWDYASGQVIAAIQGPDVDVSPAEWYDLNHVAFSPDDSKVAVSFGGNVEYGRIWILDAEMGQLLLEIQTPGDVGAIDWRPDGSRIAGLVSYPMGSFVINFLREWNTKTGEQTHEYMLQSSLASATRYSPNGNQVAFTDGYAVGVFDESTWDSPYYLEGHEDFVLSLTWKPDGSKIASIDQGHVFIWDAVNSQLLTSFPKSHFEWSVDVVAWSPDGNHIAATASPIIEMWDADTHQLVLSYDAGGYISQLIWHPDGTLIYSSGAIFTFDPFQHEQQ